MSIAHHRVWLAVMPDQRHAARTDAGTLPDGRSAIAWSQADQLWYARPGADLSRLQAWMPDRSIRSSGGGDPQSEFLDALTRAGLVLDGLPVMDGQRHRVPVLEGKRGNRDGVYRGFLDGIKPGGWFINYHRADNDKDITRWKASGHTGEADPVARVHMRAVMRQSQDSFARDQAARYARQTARAKALYDRLPAADPAHGYLTRKGITVATDIRQTRNGTLVVPFYDVDGTFRTLQYISPDGGKYLYKDAPKSGHFRVEGGELRNGEPILYAEGYATARSLHMVTGRPVVMTIDAGNMPVVADVLTIRYPDSPHLFMADVDHAKEKNKGVLSAQHAAAATGGAVLLPDLTAADIARGLTDFNDLHQSRGAERLRATLLPDINQALERLNDKDPPMSTPDDAPRAPSPLTPAAPVALPGPARRRPGAAQVKAAEIFALRDQGMKPAQIARQLAIGQTSVYRLLRAQQVAEPEKLIAERVPPVPDAPSVDAKAVAPAAAEPIAAASPPDPAARDTSSQPMQQATAASADEENWAIPGEENTILTGPRRIAPSDGPQQAAEPARLNAEPVSPVPDAPSVDAKAVAPAAAEPTAAASPPDPAARDTSSQPVQQAAAAGADEENWAIPDEENAILTGPRRIAPSDDDVPETRKQTCIDADKLLSRVTYEEQPDGKSVLYKLDGEPAFLDFGNRLVMAEGASAHEEKVLATLLTAARHYHGRIELTGSDAFKTFALSVIVANRLDVSMKVASQQAALDEARRAAGQPTTPLDAVRGEPAVPRAGAKTPNATPPPPAPTATLGSAAPVIPSTQAGVPQATSTAAGTPETPSAVHTPAEKAREAVTGKVTACGQAPFRFEPKAAESTFITLRTKAGTQTFWGKELAGLLRETRLQPGRMVSLQWLGKQPVTVKVPRTDDTGAVTHYESIERHRNQWVLAPARGDRVQTGDDTLVPLSAYDAGRFTQVQRAVIARLQLDMPPPPIPSEGLYWVRPDGQGSTAPGDALSAERPAQNPQAGGPVMSAWASDGTPDLYLVQGEGHYLQGVVRQAGVYQHVLVSLPDSKGAPPMVVNMLTPEGAVPVGSGNGINRSNGQPVPREHVVIRLTGDEQPRIAKLDTPAALPPTLHARLGFDERYKAEAAYPKERPGAAPQAAPVTPPRPA
ncbi:LPD7 domain-containing protein [Serratia symbiotica]|uniref:LPD7 domain-containing protein n=1 Tax=Serratia symbiotica TaxID=138074 RepID=UPI001CEFB343|nr:LPD7 domain-containing protein [Serratia symbiotica]